MDIHEILEYVGIVSGFIAMFGGLFLYYHMYFWINKFDRCNGIERIKGGNTWLGRVKRVGAVTWLALSLGHSRFDQWLRRQFEKDYYSSPYLKVSETILQNVRWKGLFLLISFIIGFGGFLIYMLLEKFV